MRTPPVSLGHIQISPSRRLRAVLRRTALGDRDPIVDLAVEISDGRKWQGTNGRLLVGVDHLHALVEKLEMALARLGEV